MPDRQAITGRYGLLPCCAELTPSAGIGLGDGETCLLCSCVCAAGRRLHIVRRVRVSLGHSPPCRGLGGGPSEICEAEHRTHIFTPLPDVPQDTRLPVWRLGGGSVWFVCVTTGVCASRNRAQYEADPWGGLAPVVWVRVRSGTCGGTSGPSDYGIRSHGPYRWADVHHKHVDLRASQLRYALRQHLPQLLWTIGASETLGVTR